METLLSGTSLAAAPLAMADRIGAIAPGLVADLVATAPNPWTTSMPFGAWSSR